MEEVFRFQGALDELQAELKNSVRQRDELEKRIASLRQSVTGLLRLRDASFDDDEPPALDVWSAQQRQIEASIAEVIDGGAFTAKLSEACRAVVKSAKRPVTAGEVRRELEVMGFFSGYGSNPLSAIHTTLKRDQYIRNFKNADGKTVYEFRETPLTVVSTAPGYMAGPVERRVMRKRRSSMPPVKN